VAPPAHAAALLRRANLVDMKSSALDRLARSALRLGAAGLLMTALAGCNSLYYYAQAVHGHFAMLHAARPIDDWLRDDATGAPLRDRLLRAQEIRRFASEALALPDNGSYKRYADIGRSAIVWNVFATPELSLKLKNWCYPVVGCASYRGYYERSAAEAAANELRAQGYDVGVTPVPAYSTLGWFDDPLLNTFIETSDAELARLLFHELAHQIVYVKGDTRFNESFATAVERAGVARWLAREADARTTANYQLREQRRAEFLALLNTHRARLETLYATPQDDAAKRAAKQATFAQLRRDYEELRNTRWGGWAGFDAFFARELNNAHIAAVGVYTDLVPAFESLLAAEGNDLPRFYERVRGIASLPPADRDRVLGGPRRSAPI
jgi:predicted aminopeptidase